MRYHDKLDRHHSCSIIMAGAAAVLLFAPVSGVTTHQTCRLLQFRDHHLWWLEHLFLVREPKISNKFYFCTHNSQYIVYVYTASLVILAREKHMQVTTVWS